MSKARLTGVTLAAMLGMAGNSYAQEPTDSVQGWTATSHPEKVIAARQALMFEIERLMVPIDSATIGPPADFEVLNSAAMSISAMLSAVPHLFPPPTNLYDPAVEIPVTIALPAIWSDFETFSAMADASTTAAASLSQASAAGAQAVQAASLNLRATCDACHSLFLRPYVPATVNSEDLEFDFDSVLPAN